MQYNSTYMNLLTFVIVVAIIALLFVFRRPREGVVGVCAFALDQTFRKNSNKSKIVEMLGKKGELSNSDIRDALGVSRRSVARYMTQLEKEDRVEQVGDIGRGVVYRLKPR